MSAAPTAVADYAGRHRLPVQPRAMWVDAAALILGAIVFFGAGLSIGAALW